MTAAIQQLFTIAETCARPKISKATFYRLGVETVHVGKSTRVTAQTVADICAGKYAAAPERLKERVAPLQKKREPRKMAAAKNKARARAFQSRHDL